MFTNDPLAHINGEVWFSFASQRGIVVSGPICGFVNRTMFVRTWTVSALHEVDGPSYVVVFEDAFTLSYWVS